MTAFASQAQSRLYDAVASEIKNLGYEGALLQEDYSFVDWFQPGEPKRVAPLAAFGQTPTTYETACLAVVPTAQKSGAKLVSDFRALGAPYVFEILEDSVSAWGVSRDPKLAHQLRLFHPDEVAAVFAKNAERWSPDSVLRAKNIKPDLRPRQLDFFDIGLIPALEHQIREKLHRLLNDALVQAQKVSGKGWEELAPAELEGLFRLVFRVLAAKILHDREVPGFGDLSGGTAPSEVLSRVEDYYGRDAGVLPDQKVWEAVQSTLWGRLNFQNLSVEVLAYIYEYTFVTKDLRKKFGIHGTPSSIARYIVRNLPFEELPQHERTVLEPCSGHGIFLVAALQRLRNLLPPHMELRDRHAYFVKMLRGIEIDAFALEVSKLCLILADFPNSNGWKLDRQDVFKGDLLADAVKASRIILCNPPFEDFTVAERPSYGNLSSVHKPVELLNRVLDDLPSAGMLGFVLPRNIIDGVGFRQIRERLARRFDSIDAIALPDDLFYVSRVESALLLAKHPRGNSDRTSVFYAEVHPKDKKEFLSQYRVSRRSVAERTPEKVATSLIVPVLAEVWDHLDRASKLGEFGNFHRGIQWTKFDEENCISDTERPGFKRGFGRVEQNLFAYQAPRVVYLNVDRTNLIGNIIDCGWEHPKVVMNASRIRRGHWRIAAFVDRDGMICAQRFHAFWPKTDGPPLEVVAAIINGPVANAYLTAHQRDRDNHIIKLKDVPFPQLTGDDRQTIVSLVNDYSARSGKPDQSALSREARRSVLLKIDGIILRGYDLPAKLERQLLEFFSGAERPVPFEFGGYDLPSFMPMRLLAGVSDPVLDWEEFNERRALLIDKELTDGLDEAEAAELQLLQDAADRYLDTVSPIVLDDLDWLEERIRNS